MIRVGGQQRNGEAVVREPVTAYVALGANLGDAQAAVKAAVDALAQQPGIGVVRCSSLYKTAPIDSSGPDYINAAAELRVTLDVMSLLAVLQSTENAAGRERPYRNAPRTLDLDLLLYGDASVSSPSLTVPHPRMLERAFVLVPLAEIAPDRVTAQQLEQVSGQQIYNIHYA